MLSRPFEVPEVVRPSYDASLVRAKIQGGLRTQSQLRTQRGRELSTAASSESIASLGDQYTAMENFLSYLGDMASNR
jgi:hypothetical protein